MASITSSGLGSGLDVESLVSSLMAYEKRPLQLLATKEASYQAKLSAFGQIKSALSSLQTATTALNDASKFSATKATVSGKGFTASSSSNAPAGSHSIEVFSLAKTQRIATSATSEFAPTGPGKLTISYGKIEGGSFVADADADRSATLEFTGSTIEELRDAINADTKLGIKASVINNGSAKQLVLTGTATGAGQAFQITGEDGLAGLAYTPGASGDMVTVEAAQDARLKVDGIEITRGKNTITDVIDGLTLTLTDEPEGDATSLKGSVSVAADSSSAKTAIEAFVKAYNEVSSTLKNLSAYNSETKTASTLTGDSTVRSIQSQLRNALTGMVEGLGDGASSLSQIGISFDKSGTLTIDSGKLGSALSNPEKNVAALFAGNGDVKGFAASFNSRLDSFLDSKGLLAGRTEGINSTIKSITKQYDTMETRLDAVEARYRSQFTSLDSLISGLSQTSTYLTQQLANLPKIGSSK